VSCAGSLLWRLLERFEDLFRGLGLDEWLGVLVLACDPFANVGFERLNAVMVRALEQDGGNVGKESLDLVDPRRVRRRGVQVEPGVRLEPLDDAGGLVGTVVIAGQMNLQSIGDLGSDRSEKFLELDGPESAVNRRDDSAVGGFERGQQDRRSGAHIVMGAFLWNAWHHWERWLGARQRLHLGLLVHTVDNGRLGRVQIQTDDVADLLHELRIGGGLESVLAVRFQLERLQESPDRRPRQARAVRHLRPRPTRCVLRRRLQRRRSVHPISHQLAIQTFTAAEDNP
jgi:hypothetical protein